MLIRVGENTTVLQLSYDRTADCVARIQSIYRELLSRNIADILGLRPGLDSLAVECRDGFDPSDLLIALKAGIDALPAANSSPEVLDVPVCYEAPFGRDLQKVADLCSCTIADVIEIHTSVVYDVWMLGFMPGFPYLGELPQILQIPRKSKPDPHIPAGSVAIAEEYCGVYPFDSPGGWHVLGRTPIPLIDYTKPRPWTFDYDMRARFVPISLSQYQDEIRKGRK